jgi:dihydrofolate reductase
MGRIIFDTATTFNGWIADEENSLGWLFAVPGGEAPEPGLEPPEAPVMIMGSTTYRWVLEQENVIDEPARWTEAFGDRLVVVFTTADLPAPEGAQVIFTSGDVSVSLPWIQEAAGEENIWIVGGGDLAAQFADAGALDEVRLSVAPVALAGGSPLFPRRLDSSRLRLKEAFAVGQFARLIYALEPAA